MWPTTSGLRCLSGDEFDLLRGAVGIMVDHLVAEGREGDPQEIYGIPWFYQWDWQQRIWLLERISLALLTDLAPPSPAAMWEATVDAVFRQILQLVQMEIDQPDWNEKKSWRLSAIDAFCCQQKRRPQIDEFESDLQAWNILIMQLADTILGVRLYQKAESFRDLDITQTKQFLTNHGLPEDFLAQIPPLRTLEQTQISIDQIQSIVLR